MDSVGGGDVWIVLALVFLCCIRALFGVDIVCRGLLGDGLSLSFVTGVTVIFSVVCVGPSGPSVVVCSCICDLW